MTLPVVLSPTPPGLQDGLGQGLAPPTLTPPETQTEGERFPITLSHASAATSLSLSLGCLPTTRGGLTQPGGDRKALKPLMAALGPPPAAHPLNVREGVLARGVPMCLRLGPGAPCPSPAHS